MHYTCCDMGIFFPHLRTNWGISESMVRDGVILPSDTRFLIGPLLRVSCLLCRLRLCLAGVTYKPFASYSSVYRFTFPDMEKLCSPGKTLAYVSAWVTKTSILQRRNFRAKRFYARGVSPSDNVISQHSIPLVSQVTT